MYQRFPPLVLGVHQLFLPRVVRTSTGGPAAHTGSHADATIIRLLLLMTLNLKPMIEYLYNYDILNLNDVNEVTFD